MTRTTMISPTFCRKCCSVTGHIQIHLTVCEVLWPNGFQIHQSGDLLKKFEVHEYQNRHMWSVSAYSDSSPYLGEYCRIDQDHKGFYLVNLNGYDLWRQRHDAFASALQAFKHRIRIMCSRITQ